MFELNQFLLNVTLIKYKQYEKALEILNEESTYSSRYLQGYIYFKQNKLDKVIEQFSLALENENESKILDIKISRIKIRFELGLAFHHEKELDKAIDCFKLCVEDSNIIFENEFLIKEAFFYLGKQLDYFVLYFLKINKFSIRLKGLFSIRKKSSVLP